MSCARNANNARPHRSFLSTDAELFFRSFIDPAPSSVYGCLTFRDAVDDTQADNSFRSLIKHINYRSRLKENIGWIRSTERTLSGLSDYGSPLHYHFIAFSHASLFPETIDRFWSASVGNCKVEPYDATKDGIGYILKMRNLDDCDWTFSENLYLFQPDYEPKNRHQRRAIDRQQLRSQKRTQNNQLKDDPRTPRMPAPPAAPLNQPGLNLRNRSMKNTRFLCSQGCGLQYIADVLVDKSVRLLCGPRP
jgi:hypothetical protein